MSLRLQCPNCGSRALEEFLHGEIPRVPDHIDDAMERDLDRAFMADNTEGVTRERWFHAAGCRRWFTVDRDTRSDQVVAVEPGADAPGTTADQD